jgi:hypothetical protein
LALQPAVFIALAACAWAQRDGAVRVPRAVTEVGEQRSVARAVRPTPKVERAPASAPAASGARPTKSSSLRRLEPARDTVAFDRVAETLWARGDNYKMAFEGGRARYVPFLASSAPQNFELEFALRGVSVGGRALELELDADALLEGAIVTLPRGALVEVYELEPRSVEQLFVFESLPERADVVVQVDVTTELRAEPRDGGFEFTNEFGRVVYSSAKAVDALGRELELAMTLESGLLSITVPEHFVASAALPLVIDPILASFGIEASPADAFSPDVTFDATGNAVLYCWETIFSAADHDVWADVYDPAGNPLYVGGWIDTTATFWGRPRSANHGASNRFLVVAHTVNATTGRVEVWGRTRSATSALLSAQFKITGASSYDVMFPDVGGDPHPSGPSFFCVAYERVYVLNADHDLHAKLVTDAGTLATPAFGIDASINTLDTDVSVSRSDGDGTWNVAWQRASPAGGHDIFGARVNWDGVIAAPTFPIAVGPADHTAPAASSSAQGSDLWVCVYEEDFGTDHDIVATGLDGATIERTLDLSVADGPFLYQDQRTPSIDSDGVHFAVAYSELYATSTSDYDVYVSEVLFNGPSLAVIEAHQPVFQTDGAEFEAQIASPESSNPAQSSHDYAVAWHRAPDNYFFFSDDVLGARYRGTAGGVVASFCGGASVACPCGSGTSTSGGCPNSVHAQGALLTWSGQASTTQDTLQFFVSGMPSGVTCLFFQGANALNGTQGQVFGDGVRCAGSPMVRLGTAQATAAGAALHPELGDVAISVRGQVASGGATLTYQVWYRNPTSFCTPSTTNFSNALVVAWTP